MKLEDLDGQEILPKDISWSLLFKKKELKVDDNLTSVNQFSELINDMQVKCIINGSHDINDLKQVYGIIFQKKPLSQITSPLLLTFDLAQNFSDNIIKPEAEKLESIVVKHRGILDDLRSFADTRSRFYEINPVGVDYSKNVRIIDLPDDEKQVFELFKRNFRQTDWAYKSMPTIYSLTYLSGPLETLSNSLVPESISESAKPHFGTSRMYDDRETLYKILCLTTPETFDSLINEEIGKELVESSVSLVSSIIDIYLHK